ncbi:AAA family ATPase [Xanthomonas arboricola]|uniref:AAA family ATPase n=1 Tax=Xanthomonas arboricola TaxID=56448 RepID=UPI002B30A9D0|nr:AAA family ATPase [Xanthomonas arboricola]
MMPLRDSIASAKVRHFHFDQTIRAAVSQMTFAVPGSVLALVGPTRVGKSTAIRAAAKQVYPRMQDGYIPYVVVDCSRTDAGFMSMRYLTLDLLGQLEHPFYGASSGKSRVSQTETNARLALRRAIKHRETKLIIVDEAHHLLRIKNSSGREAALESLKCLGNETGAVIVLVGGYELLKGCFCSAHFNGRLTLIEFPRYGRSDAQMRQFESILATFDQLLPWAKGNSLLSMSDLVYDGTLGSCGLISSWVLAALGQMDASGATRLRSEHFRNVRYYQQIDAIASEIDYGESVLRPIESGHQGEKASSTHSTSDGGTGRKSRRLKPGRRKPTRDSLAKPEMTL